MMADVFRNMDILIKNAGTTDPFELCDYLDVILEKMYSRVIGYVVHIYKPDKIRVGYNVKMPYVDQCYTLMHEYKHVVDDLPTGRIGPMYQEIALFTLDKNIAIEEREANICAAEYTVPTDDVLELTGYNNSTVREYRELKEEIEDALHSHDASAKQLRHMCDDLEELEMEIAHCESVHTTEQIARLLGYKEAYITYKIEALRLRGYDIPQLELPDSHQVFGLR